jgi:hypothetical protein
MPADEPANPRPNKQSIFNELRKLLAAYSPPYQPRMQTDHAFDLWAEGDYEAFDKKRKEIFFASAIVQSDYVGFYFMPIYSDVESVKQLIPPRLLKMLKGKSCFHINDWDDELAVQIRTVLKSGYAIYQARGWL